MDEPVTVEQVRGTFPLAPAVLSAPSTGEGTPLANAREFRRALEQAFNESYRRLTERIEVVATDRGDVSTENMVYMEGGNFLIGNDFIRESARAGPRRLG